MEKQQYQITRLTQEAPDTFIIQVKPLNDTVFSFIPGQFVGIAIPNFTTKKINHFFSIASSPDTTHYLEFCFKVYGEWTKKLSEQKEGDTLFITVPYGKFMWDEKIPYAVFLAGGVGVTPFVSMFRSIHNKKQAPRITLLYGNRTEKTIAYKTELETLIAKLPNNKIIHILSEVSEQNQWQGHKGFLTKEILEKEVALSANPVFFVCGPLLFVQHAKKILSELSIDQKRIKEEIF